MTTKVLDATTISVGMGDIRAVDIIERCASTYTLTTTREVRGEIERGFAHDRVGQTFSHIPLSSVRSPEYGTLLAYLQSRFPFLHTGELSSFLLALFNYELEGEPYYYVTDDWAMRKAIRKILNSDRLIEIVGKKIPSLRVTGTIGLMMRMHERGVLSGHEIGRIADDLETGTFRISEELLQRMRRGIDEA